MFNRNFFERGQDIIPLINQGDIDTDITGDWVKVRDYNRVGFLMAKYGTEDVDDQGMQLLQATDASGTSSKALSVPIGASLYYKTGTLTSQTVWTKVSVTAAIDGMAFGSSVPTGFTRIVSDVNTNALLVYVEFETTNLDTNNSFDWVTCFFEGDNCNNACLVSVWAILGGGRYPQSVPLSAIS